MQAIKVFWKQEPKTFFRSPLSHKNTRKNIDGKKQIFKRNIQFLIFYNEGLSVIISSYWYFFYFCCLLLQLSDGRTMKAASKVIYSTLLCFT